MNNDNKRLWQDHIVVNCYPKLFFDTIKTMILHFFGLRGAW